MGAALEELAEEDYRQAIEEETADRAAEIIEAGIKYGDGDYRISMTLREELGGFEARKRALMIARTETTNAMNHGHLAEAETLEGLGLAIIAYPQDGPAQGRTRLNCAKAEHAGIGIRMTLISRSSKGLGTVLDHP